MEMTIKSGPGNCPLPKIAILWSSLAPILDQYWSIYLVKLWEIGRGVFSPNFAACPLLFSVCPIIIFEGAKVQFDVIFSNFEKSAYF